MEDLFHLRENFFPANFTFLVAHCSENILVAADHRLWTFHNHCFCNWTSFHHQMKRFLLSWTLNR
jgi:hypothetical protein